MQNDSLSVKNPLNVTILTFRQHRTTPEQAKIYVANHFRANAQIT